MYVQLFIENTVLPARQQGEAAPYGNRKSVGARNGPKTSKFHALILVPSAINGSYLKYEITTYEYERTYSWCSRSMTWGRRVRHNFRIQAIVSRSFGGVGCLFPSTDLAISSWISCCWER
jgi:hypothetical protein